MYEVWFMDYFGNWWIDEVFDSYKEAYDYADTACDNFGYEDIIIIIKN